MSIKFRANGYVREVNVKLPKVANVIRLMNSLGYDVLKVGK